MIRPGSSRWEVVYHTKVIEDDISALDSPTAKRIKLAIENKLAINPLLYGSPLHGVLEKFFKLRVSDWRVIYTIIGKKVVILIIGNRKDIYKIANRRLS